MRKKKRIAKQSREGAKPSPAAGIGTHARGRAVEAGGLARSVRLVFWAGGSPPEGQGGRRRTEGAEQEEGGVWSGCAVTELVLPGGGKIISLPFQRGRRSRLSGCSLPVGLRRHRSFQLLRRAFSNAFGDHPPPIIADSH